MNFKISVLALTLTIAACSQQETNSTTSKIIMPFDSNSSLTASKIVLAINDTSSNVSGPAAAVASMYEPMGVIAMYNVMYTTQSELPEPLNSVDVNAFSFATAEQADEFIKKTSGNDIHIEGIGEDAFQTNSSMMTFRVGQQIIQATAFDDNTDIKEFSGIYAKWLITSAE
jgi:hypothetical protein